VFCVFLWEQVVWVSEDLDTPEALSVVLHLLTAHNFLVVSGDLVCDVPGGCSCSCTEATGSSSDSPVVASSLYSQFWNCIWWQDQATYRIWYYWPQFNASTPLVCVYRHAGQSSFSISTCIYSTQMLGNCFFFSVEIFDWTQGLLVYIVFLHEIFADPSTSMPAFKAKGLHINLGFATFRSKTLDPFRVICRVPGISKCIAPCYEHWGRWRFGLT
jgi:hypothetical protein